MAARPDKNPGLFKLRPNYAGGTAFVAPAQLIGTIKAGWDVCAEVVDPFQRAVMIRFPITECHPFDDGNGRLARIMSNAELIAQNQWRVVIPTSYRGNYLAALSGATHNASGSALHAALDFTRRWASSIDWSDWQRKCERPERVTRIRGLAGRRADRPAAADRALISASRVSQCPRGHPHSPPTVAAYPIKFAAVGDEVEAPDSEYGRRRCPPGFLTQTLTGPVTMLVSQVAPGFLTRTSD